MAELTSSTREAARRLGVSDTTMHKAERTGRITREPDGQWDIAKLRSRGHFPGDEAAMKLLYLVLNRAAEEWKRPPRKWYEAKTQFAILFGDRFVV